MRYREKTKKRPVELLIITKRLKPKKKKVKLNRDIEKEHTEKEEEEDTMINMDFINSRFSK